MMATVRTEWIRALVPSAGAGAALAAGTVCAVLAVMGAMTFGLWGSRAGSDAGAMAIPGVPRPAPAAGGDVEDAGADAAAATDATETSPRRPRRPAHQTTVVAERPAARGRAITPSPQATSRPPTAQPVRPQAVVSPPAHAQAATSVVAATAPQLPSSGAALPRPVRDAPGTVRRTAEAVLAPVERAADAAQSGVRAVADPVIARLPAPAPSAPQAAEVVAGALPAGAPSP